MEFPSTRLRRLRQSAPLRRLVRETELNAGDLVLPAFVIPGRGLKEEIPSMPGCFRFSIDKLVDEVKEGNDLGLGGVILFGIPEQKDSTASGAYAAGGIVQRAVEQLKKSLPEVLVITDVCLCEYTDHGHCGVVRKEEVENDATIELLAKIAVSHARSGADALAPSDMMDGRVKTIRQALDREGFQNAVIISYAVKYASAFYGPFRDAAECAPSFGDRSSYQMDVANVEEALREASLDIDEGADIIMVKPALAYLDVIHRVKQRFGHPLAAFNVSGEYAMVEGAVRSGCLDRERIVLEILTSIKRAGADFIISYHAKEAARVLGRGDGF
ncbi:MAG: porphobilinogen synthase [Candidatus Eiseniibacteriota bacterium]|nr:MAG: porphobilinogen synthase [Candidatus Eisenbacteria bacterium]